MKKAFITTFMIVAIMGILSCDDVFKPVDPHLEGTITTNGYEFIITNMGEVNGSRGGPMVAFHYTLYYAQGDHSEIPTTDVNSTPALPCPASGKWGYNSHLTGVYTFWVVGILANNDSGEKTGPSNLVVLDFDQ